MTLLSVIIPVCADEDRLVRCVDSILGGPPAAGGGRSVPGGAAAAGLGRPARAGRGHPARHGADLEVIAVRDATPDARADLLARRAAVDARLSVVTVAGTDGSGPARDAGLAAATGDHVWFVDGHDRLPAGAVASVLRSLRRTAPDVLVTGFARVGRDNRLRREVPTRALDEPQLSTPALAGLSALVAVAPVGGNRIVRRELLSRHGIDFGPRWYCDVSFHLRAMVAAERIELLERCCYVHRQRAAAPEARASSDRHFDAFAEWDRVFDFLDACPEVPETLRGVIFHRMVWHLLQILGHADLVPWPRRREFFAEIVARHRRHHPPAGCPRPAGATGLSYRLVARGAYRVFEAVRAAHRARADLSRQIRRPVTAAQGAAGQAVARTQVMAGRAALLSPAGRAPRRRSPVPPVAR